VYKKQVIILSVFHHEQFSISLLMVRSVGAGGLGRSKALLHLLVSNTSSSLVARYGLFYVIAFCACKSEYQYKSVNFWKFQPQIVD
jgi:hypothetical protein